MKTKNTDTKSTIKFITTIISWTVFVILIIIALILLYYFISTKRYEKKGEGYEPAFTLYTIISPSMAPNINVYDVIVNTKVKDPRDINIGDVISYDSTDFSVGKSISVTHRVIERMVDKDGNYTYTTKGDNNDIQDAYPVAYGQVTGKVLMRIPQLGRIQFFIASKSGWLLIIVIPALYIIIKDIFKVFKITEKKGKKRKNILFMPIKKKPLYLPLHGYVNEQGEKEKFSISSLIPFTFERPQEEIEKEPIPKTSSLEEIYKDLEQISDNEKK